MYVLVYSSTAETLPVLRPKQSKYVFKVTFDDWDSEEHEAGSGYDPE